MGYDFQREDCLFSSFAIAYGKQGTTLSKAEWKMINRLVFMCLPGYDASLNPRTVRKALRTAHKEGKMVKAVLDSRFWINGRDRDQLDGWSYHLVLYSTIRKNKEDIKL